MTQTQKMRAAIPYASFGALLTQRRKQAGILQQDYPAGG
jgi:hypothetical protein